MALRVLLADESSTIKKVMMLALQDFAVEVKSVPVGLDVLAVTKTYKPDIIFADVLLTKRNGYEVSSDVKLDSETAHIPVVLMWSGFMELDEVKASESKADRRLEKPFDADTLRGLVHELVKKTRSNPLSEYLTFPQMPEFEERQAKPTAVSQKNVPLALPPHSNDTLLPNDDSIDDIYAIPDGEEFSQVPLSGTPRALNETRQDSAEEGGWAHQDLSKFKIEIPSNGTNSEHDDFASKFVIPHDELSQAHIQVSGNFEEISFSEPKTKTKIQTLATEKPTTPLSAMQPMETVIKDTQESVKNQSRVDINSEMMEKIIREQAREMIESICWKILPDIAERVVREEIQKILRDT